MYQNITYVAHLMQANHTLWTSAACCSEMKKKLLWASYLLRDEKKNIFIVSIFLPALWRLLQVKSCRKVQRWQRLQRWCWCSSNHDSVLVQVIRENYLLFKIVCWTSNGQNWEFVENGHAPSIWEQEDMAGQQGTTRSNRGQWLGRLGWRPLDPWPLK